MSFLVKSPAGLYIPDEEMQEAYDAYCALTKNPKSVEEIEAEGGWTLKTIQAFRRGVLPPGDRIARLLAFLEEDGGEYEYDAGVLNGLRLALDAYENTIKTFALAEAPRLSTPKAAPKKKQPEPEPEPEPAKTTKGKKSSKAG